MEYLTYWCTKYMNSLRNGRYVVLKDKEDDFSFLWYSTDTEDVVHQMQSGYSPTVYPVPKYELVGIF